MKRVFILHLVKRLNFVPVARMQVPCGDGVEKDSSHGQGTLCGLNIFEPGVVSTQLPTGFTNSLML